MTQLKAGVMLDIEDLGPRRVRGTLVDVDQDRVRIQTDSGATEELKRVTIQCDSARLDFDGYGLDGSLREAVEKVSGELFTIVHSPGQANERSE